MLSLRYNGGTMNKMTIIVSIFVALVIGAGVIVFFATEETEAPARQDTVNETTQAPEITELTTEAVNNYVVYEEGAIEAAEGQVVLFFHAVWCPQCLQLERDIRQNGVPEGYTIIEVDFDRYQDLRQRYEVVAQTTLVRLDENGDKIDSFLPSELTIDAVKRDYLDT